MTACRRTRTIRTVQASNAAADGRNPPRGTRRTVTDDFELRKLFVAARGLDRNGRGLILSYGNVLRRFFF